MTTYLASYLATALVFLGIDAVWLRFMTGAFYRPTLGDVLAERVNYPPAVAFYLIYVAGIVYFAVAPALEAGRWTVALGQGAAFGFFAYATYDLTNHATLRNWTTTLTVVDIAWGTFLTSASAVLAYLLVRALLGSPA